MNTSSEDRRLATEVLTLRYWQHLLNEDLKLRRFKIPIHLAFGYEAIATAVANSMYPDDELLLTHRNVAYNLARSRDLESIRAEYALNHHGMAGGRLGSMNLANPKQGVTYTSSILGNNLSVACGLALAKQMKRQHGVVTVLTGDGAMEEGQFYESLTFARSHSLPVIFLVENNDQSMSSTVNQRRTPISLAGMCDSLGIVFVPLAGNDVFHYHATVKDARATVASAARPACLEVRLTAFNQHAGPTPGWPSDPKNISLANGLLLATTDDDPLFTLKRTIGENLFASLVEEVLGREAALVG